VRGDSSRVGAYSAAAGWLQQTGWLKKTATVAPAPALGLADTNKVQQQCLQGGGPGRPGLHDATAVVGVTSCAKPAPSRAVEVHSTPSPSKYHWLRALVAALCSKPFLQNIIV
jgi:hypothetical protein